MLLPRTYVVRARASRSRGALRALRRNQDVLYAEANGTARAVAAPNDPLMPQLWGLVNTGQTVDGRAGSPGADVDALAAWETSLGSPEVLVAVVDTGMDRDHEDLRDNAWTNPGEAGALSSNGVDDDANGLVDDWRGWDFAYDDDDPSDVDGHGTHVSGTIGATGDNGIGVTGVNQRVSLVGVKVLGDGGWGTFADVADGFAYAGRIGADVANASLGGPGTYQAVADAIAGAPDTLFVVAAGNDSENVDHYPFSPCAEPPDNLICVAATDNVDQLAWFSNTGAASVDLGAPGHHVMSTVPGGYDSYSGTSMASPHVAGAAALLAAVWPGDGALALKSRILEGVDHLAALQGVTVSGGRLDLRGSLGLPANPAPEARLTVAPDPPEARRRARLDASASTDDGRIVGYRWDLDGDGSFEQRTDGPAVDHVYATTGPRSPRVQVLDDRGAAATATRPFTVASPPAGTPDVSLSYAPEAPIVGDDVTVTATPAAGSIAPARHEWDLDGDWTYETDTGADAQVTRSFASVGPHPIGVRATSPTGPESEVRAVVRVVRSAPTARATVTPEDPLPNERVRFDMSGSSDRDGELIWYAVDFEGDGWSYWRGDYSGESPVATWRYDRPGTYTARVTVYDNDQQAGTTDVPVTVRDPVALAPARDLRATEQPGDSDGDGVLEPGEAMRIEQDLRNDGGTPLQSITGTASGDHVDAGATGTWPDLAPGQAASPTSPVGIATYGSATCGRPLPVDLRLDTAEGEAVLPLRVETGAPGPKGSNTQEWPFELQPGWWLWQSMNISGEGGIKDIDLRLDDIRHGATGELVIGASAESQDVLLVHRQGGEGDDFVGTVFDDEGTTSIEDAEPPFTGRYRPQGWLGVFDGQDARHGTGLYIENWSYTHVAYLNKWGADVSIAECHDDRANSAPIVPDPVITPQPIAGRPSEVSVEGAYDPDGRITRYHWDLDGDRVPEQETTEPRATIVPSGAHWHYIEVWAVDDDRATTRRPWSFKAFASEPPVARAVVSPDPTWENELVTLDATGSTDPDGRIVETVWTIDGQTFPGGWGPIAEVRLPTGYYYVAVEVRDDSGETAMDAVGLEVHGPDWPPGAPPEDTDPDDGGEGETGGGGQPSSSSGSLTSGPPLVAAQSSPFGALPSRAPGAAPQGRRPTVPLIVTAPFRLRAAQLRHGLPAVATCAQQCRVVAELRLTRRRARRLGLWPKRRRGRHLVIGRRVAVLRPGEPAELRLRAGAAARRAIARGGGVRATLVVKARRRGRVTAAAVNAVQLTP